MVEEAHERGRDVLELLDEVFLPLIKEVGDKFSRGDIYLPELIMAAEVIQAVTEKVAQFLPEGARRESKKGIAVLGTVEGDVHDIGKNLVLTMLDVGGFQVFDLGRDVPARTFVQKAREVSADLIGSSALLSTTMSTQRTIEELLVNAGLKSKIRTLIGGAPVTPHWAKTIGADAYGKDAAEAALKARELLGQV
jgi:trimethylamine corrinoid protein